MHVSDCLGISQGELLGKILDELELTDIHLVGPDVGMALLPLRCLLYTSPSPRDRTRSRMPSSA